MARKFKCHVLNGGNVMVQNRKYKARNVYLSKVSHMKKIFVEGVLNV